MRDALKPALGAAFKAAGFPRLCASQQRRGMGAAAPTGLRPGEMHASACYAASNASSVWDKREGRDGSSSGAGSGDGG